MLHSRDFERLMHSTVVPTDQEAHQIRNALSNDEIHAVRLDERIRQLTDEIKRIQFILHPLEAERSELRSTIDARKAMIGPIRRIPPEVLGHIFIHCLPNRQSARPIVKRIPLLLCKICSAWRMTALATPQLWSSFYFSDIDLMRDEYARTWLGRSGVLPLTIGIGDMPVDPEVFADPLVKIYFARCQNLCLDMGWWCLRTFFLDNGLTWGSLNWVDIYYISGFSRDSGVLTFPTSATNLRKIQLQSPINGDHLNLSQISLPWSYLTHFSSTPYLSADDVLELLRRCPELTQFSIKCKGRPSAVSPVIHRALRSLHIEYHGASQQHLGQFFDSISLPALQEMHMQTTERRYEPTIWPTAQIISFLTRSACPLQKLGIKWWNMSEEDILACVYCVPSLMETIRLHPNGEVGEDDTVPESVLSLLASRRLQRK